MKGRLTLQTTGLHTTIVDGGRPHSRSLGVPLGGAADRLALQLGNALVGNPPLTSALEITLIGPTLSADVPLACVLFGAPFTLETDSRSLRAGKTFTLQPGELLRIGGTAQGARAYLCIRGGIEAPLILGSRSGLTALTAGTQLECQAGEMAGRFLDWEPEPVDAPLRVLPGGQADWFAPEALTQTQFTVTPASNRMGIRLHGPPLWAGGREMVSEPVCPGTVQVTRDGQCIVLGVDGQTIGGYPRIAQVISADLDRLGQLRPGETIRFVYVGLAEAESAARQRQQTLRRWLAVL